MEWKRRRRREGEFEEEATKFCDFVWCCSRRKEWKSSFLRGGGERERRSERKGEKASTLSILSLPSLNNRRHKFFKKLSFNSPNSPICICGGVSVEKREEKGTREERERKEEKGGEKGV